MRNFVVEEWSCEGTAKIAKVNTLLKFSSVSDLFLEAKLGMHKVVHTTKSSVLKEDRKYLSALKDHHERLETSEKWK